MTFVLFSSFWISCTLVLGSHSASCNTPIPHNLGLQCHNLGLSADAIHAYLLFMPRLWSKMLRTIDSKSILNQFCLLLPNYMTIPLPAQLVIVEVWGWCWLLFVWWFIGWFWCWFFFLFKSLSTWKHLCWFPILCLVGDFFFMLYLTFNWNDMH